MMTEINVDLIEVSGGTYEMSVALSKSKDAFNQKAARVTQFKGDATDAAKDGNDTKDGDAKDATAVSAPKMRESTRKREAYFLEFAEEVRRVLPHVPLMVTGGFRAVEGMNDAIASGITDIVGLGRPACHDLAVAAKLLSGATTNIELPNVTVGNPALDNGLEALFYQCQFDRYGRGLEYNPKQSLVYCLTVMLGARYIWDPRAYSSKTKRIFAMVCGGLAAAAAAAVAVAILV
eukprot:GFYU01008215.1.p1 GENE.GFYU01008215.1~~GFYU01008215.1.p1  ORF type:complete len:246 (-),score=71.64 GFYU01008215.1:488-1189(-)